MAQKHTKRHQSPQSNTINRVLSYSSLIYYNVFIRLVPKTYKKASLSTQSLKRMTVEHATWEKDGWVRLHLPATKGGDAVQAMLPPEVALRLRAHATSEGLLGGLSGSSALQAPEPVVAGAWRGRFNGGVFATASPGASGA